MFYIIKKVLFQVLQKCMPNLAFNILLGLIFSDV